MILPGEAPPGMVCGNSGAGFILIVGTRDHALHCNAMDGHASP